METLLYRGETCHQLKRRVNFRVMPSPLTVLYEDDYLIAFDKPSGMLSVPDRWDKSLENLMGVVHATFSPNYFNVHRLDRETSGVLLCAKNKPILDRMATMVEKGEMEKVYVAITRGVPRQNRGRLTWRLGADPHHPGLMRVVPSGKPAITEYETVEVFSHYAFVWVRPITGRTHQIRVHLARMGCPVLADSFYGDGRGLFLSEIKRGYKFKENKPERPLLGRLALHAHRLIFAHPYTNLPTTIESPLPHEFQIALKYLRRFGGVKTVQPANGEGADP